jgi:dTMP kinase
MHSVSGGENGNRSAFEAAVIPHRKKGLFISFEGIDGSGKSVQAERLHVNLLNKGYRAVLLREPGGTAVSERIRDILLDRNHVGLIPLAELFLYEAARAQLIDEKISPELGENRIVIADRFMDSTVAYQAYGRNLSLSMVHEMNNAACKGIFPDLTFFLDISLNVSRKRMIQSGKNDRMEKQEASFFRRVRRGYQDAAIREPKRFVRLNGQRKADELEKEILQIVMVLVQNRKNINRKEKT